MHQVLLEAQLRRETGKGAARKLRAGGLVPAVMYGHGDPATPLTLNAHEVHQILSHEGENVIITLKLDAGDEATVMVRSTQHDPVKGTLRHVDFQQIRMDEEIHTTVAVESKGDAVGVKMGGILEHMLWDVEVRCLPTSIPEALYLDVSALDIGDTLHVRDVVPPEGVTIVTDADQAVFSVVVPAAARALEEEEAAAAAEALAEAEAAEGEAAPAEEAEGAADESDES